MRSLLYMGNPYQHAPGVSIVRTCLTLAWHIIELRSISRYKSYSYLSICSFFGSVVIKYDPEKCSKLVSVIAVMSNFISPLIG